MAISKQNQIIKEDVKKWAVNALIFAIPAILVLLADIRELIPNDAAWGVLALYGVNLLVDLLRKYRNKKRY